jgi:hypothetical protein
MYLKYANAGIAREWVLCDVRSVGFLAVRLRVTDERRLRVTGDVRLVGVLCFAEVRKEPTRKYRNV